MFEQFYLNLIVIPLAVIGAYQIIRGIANVILSDVEEKDLTGWIKTAYIAVTILGCLTLIFVPKPDRSDSADSLPENPISVPTELSNEFQYDLETAQKHAKEKTGYDLHEALDVIWAYQDMPDDRNDVPYDAMVDTLYYFASYISDKYNLD